MSFFEDFSRKLILERLVIGLEEPILIKGVGQMMAKVDSGNDGYNVIHGEDCYQEGDVLVFTTYDINGNMRKVSKKIVDTVRIHIGSGNIEERPVVSLNIKFANEDYKEIPFSVANRGENKMKVLISKNFVKNELDALIDVGAIGISGEGIEYEQISEGQTWDGVKRILDGTFGGAKDIIKGNGKAGLKRLAKGTLGGTKDVVVGTVKNLGRLGSAVLGGGSSGGRGKTYSSRSSSKAINNTIQQNFDEETDNGVVMKEMFDRLTGQNNSFMANKVRTNGVVIPLLDYKWRTDAAFGLTPEQLNPKNASLNAETEANVLNQKERDELSVKEREMINTFGDNSKFLSRLFSSLYKICKETEADSFFINEIKKPGQLLINQWSDFIGAYNYIVSNFDSIKNFSPEKNEKFLSALNDIDSLIENEGKLMRIETFRRKLQYMRKYFISKIKKLKVKNEDDEHYNKMISSLLQNFEIVWENITNTHVENKNEENRLDVSGKTSAELYNEFVSTLSSLMDIKDIDAFKQRIAGIDTKQTQDSFNTYTKKILTLAKEENEEIKYRRLLLKDFKSSITILKSEYKKTFPNNQKKIAQHNQDIKNRENKLNRRHFDFKACVVAANDETDTENILINDNVKNLILYVSQNLSNAKMTVGQAYKTFEHKLKEFEESYNARKRQDGQIRIEVFNTEGMLSRMGIHNSFKKR